MICKFCNGELPEDVTLCPHCGKETIAIAGAIAVGILMVSTIVKFWTEYKVRHIHH